MNRVKKKTQTTNKIVVKMLLNHHLFHVKINIVCKNIFLTKNDPYINDLTYIKILTGDAKAVGDDTDSPKVSVIDSKKSVGKNKVSNLGKRSKYPNNFKKSIYSLIAKKLILIQYRNK